MIPIISDPEPPTKLGDSTDSFLNDYEGVNSVKSGLDLRLKVSELLLIVHSKLRISTGTAADIIMP
jgi:hypothetical protein